MPGTHLKEGDKAPNFKVQTQDGSTLTLADFKGKKLILYFYPEDDTSVCTVQACNMSDGLDQLRTLGYEVYGVSPDSVESHQKFIAKYNLKQPLLADPDRKMMTDYGVYGEKVSYGRIIIGIHRIAFVINEKGIIEHIVTGVKSKTSTQQVLKRHSS